MREIKFRALHKAFGMSRPYTAFKDGGIVHFDSVSKGALGDIQNHASITQNMEWMQYTGLHDTNGKEIYEGDIVEFTYWWFDGNHAESQLKGEIVYLTDCMSFGLKGVKNKAWCDHVGCHEDAGDTAAFANWLFDEADFHVIGNIHENQELLK